MDISKQERINVNDLKRFSYFTSFQLFLFSMNEDNRPCFLLRKKKKNLKFTNFSGSTTGSDYSIILALARHFVQKTKGILASHHWKYFSKDSSEDDTNNITLELSVPKLQRQKNFTPAVNDICQLACETPYIYQDNNGEVTYFIEIPKLDLDGMNDFLKKSQIPVQFQYFKLEHILKCHCIDSNLQEGLEKNFKLLHYINKFLVKREPIEFKEHYAIICCEPIIYTHLLHSLMYPIYKKHGECWKFYKAYNNELPTDQELHNLKGIIIPGSSLSVSHSEEIKLEWYLKVTELINKISVQCPQINLLGICFGAQVIAQALGGNVSKLHGEFIQKSEILSIQSEFYELPYIKTLNLDNSKPLVIAQSHGEHIVELPTEAIKLASSKTSDIEIFAIKNNILGFQGHPDLNEGWAKQARPKDLSLREKAAEITHEEFSLICYNFLKKNSEAQVTA